MKHDYRLEGLIRASWTTQTQRINWDVSYDTLSETVHIVSTDGRLLDSVTIQPRYQKTVLNYLGEELTKVGVHSRAWQRILRRCEDDGAKWLS